MFDIKFDYKVTTNSDGIRQFPDAGDSGIVTKVICKSEIASYLVGWIPTDLKCIMYIGDHFNSYGMKYEVTNVDTQIAVKYIGGNELTKE